jgi:aldose 1-epimerase
VDFVFFVVHFVEFNSGTYRRGDNTMKNIEVQSFGIAPEGIPANLYTLDNSQGIIAKITNYGGIIVSLTTPDRQGKESDIVLGFDTLEEYVRKSPYFGCITGRYANRIAKGEFTLEGKKYKVAINAAGDNHLHGGLKGFDKVVWKTEDIYEEGNPGISLSYVSPDGEEGYPGNLSVNVKYILTSDNDLRIDYFAETDKTTIINLTNHSYFNLAGAGMGNILDHMLMIRAKAFTPISSAFVPTGEIRGVKGTPLDFNTLTRIGERIDQDDEQLRYGLGYDHNWVLDSRDGSLAPAARVVEPTSGRTMDVFTTEPGVQFYAGNFLDGTIIGKNGKRYNKRDGLCLETQHFPDSIHHPNFPTTILHPGEKYTQTTVYRFGTE